MNSLLPGYGQFLLGRRIRGAVFAITALISLVIAFFAIFNYYVDILRISVNVYLICLSIAIFDSMPKLQRSGIYDRFVNICLAGGVWLGCFFYVNSASTAISGFLWDGAELLTLGNNYNPDSVIQRGDTVIVRREQSYKRGSIIIFEHLQPYLYGGRLALHEHMRGLDKIIGLPGEQITVKNGIVMVNGKILDGQKELMLFVGKIPDMQWMLSENEYFAVNSNMQPRLMNYMAQQRKSTVIEANAIKGRIVRIVSPVYRRSYL
ncbi:MAG: S26 family signal peptidase [Victivallaceae bacterium]